MRKIRKRFFILLFFILILFISLVTFAAIETNPTKNIVPEKIEKVKEKDKSQKITTEEEKENVEQTDPTDSVTSSNIIIPYPHSDFKTYMYASAVTDTTSAQYQLISQAYVGDYGIMMVDGCYLVAMGTAYANYIGQKYQVTFETGQVIDVMIGDVKQDIHTDQYNSAGITNGDLLEFIVAQPPQEVAIMGNYNIIFPGKVAYLTII